MSSLITSHFCFIRLHFNKPFSSCLTSVIFKKYLCAPFRSVICNDPDISLVPVGFPVDTSKLRIEKTAIQQIPREALNYLSSLEFLWMSFNTLSTLSPESFRGLFNLEELRLDGNALTAFPWESLMDMPSLRLLDLHNNQLTSLPAEATSYIKNLTYLDLSSNSLLTLPMEVLTNWLAVKPMQGPESSKMILGKKALSGCLN